MIHDVVPIGSEAKMSDREDAKDEPGNRGRPVPCLEEQRRLRRDRAEAHDEGEVDQQVRLVQFRTAEESSLRSGN
jgi:hypothetical protein